jgi:hypothetical protein
LSSFGVNFSRTSLQEHSRRAIAKCTNSTIVSIGIFVGILIGGPSGAMVGAALTTPLGIAVEKMLKDTYIQDPKLRAEFEEVTIGRVLYETLCNTLAAGAISLLAVHINGITKDFVLAAGRQFSQSAVFMIRVGIMISKMSLFGILKR